MPQKRRVKKNKIMRKEEQKFIHSYQSLINNIQRLVSVKGCDTNTPFH